MRAVGVWLRSYRHDNAINAERAARTLGKHRDALRSVERAVISCSSFPTYVTMQQWTQMLGLYFDVGYEGFDDIDFASDQVLTSMRLLAGLGEGRDHWAFAAAIERLRVVRERRGLSHPQVSALRGGADEGGNYKRWEERSSDPQLYMMFNVARVLGGRARLLIGDTFAGVVRVTG